MNWRLAIARNRAALIAVVAAIVAMLGGREGGPVARRLRNAALALLRPAEAAARRLIVVAARGLVVTPRPPRTQMFAGGAGRGGARPPAFRLFDRPKRFTLRLPVVQPRGVPRIRTFWGAPPSFIPAPEPAEAPKPARPDPDAPVDAGRLRQRLAALETALADLPRQARRLSRRLAHVSARSHPNLGPAARTPLRFGRPPGFRKRAGRDVDLVLAECHALACDALRPDTS